MISKNRVILLLTVSLLIFTLFLSSNIQANETVTIGVDGDYPPYTWFEEGEFKGFDIEVLTRIFEYHEIDYELESLPWEVAVPALADGRIDVLCGGLGITAAREEVIDFADPYFIGQSNIIVRTDSGHNVASALADGSNVGALSGSIELSLLEEFNEHPEVNLNITSYESDVLGVTDLGHGRIEAMLIPNIAAYELVEAGYDIKLIGEVFHDDQITYGVTKGDPYDLIPVIHEGLEWLWETGQWEELWMEYMSDAFPAPGPLPLSRAD